MTEPIGCSIVAPVANVRSLTLSELEAWAIEDMIRHTWTDEGKGVGRALLLKVFALIHEFEARRSDASAPAELPVGLTEEELWAIDYHIRRGHLDPSGVRVGRDLLLKVFSRLLDIRNAEEMKRLKLGEASDSESPDHMRRLRELRDHLRRADDPAASDGSQG